MRRCLYFVLSSEMQPVDLNQGKFKMDPAAWTSSVDQVHGPGPSNYGPGPYTPYFYYL